MKIVIRTDASIESGTGHVMRCLALAAELRRRGGNVRFLCRRQAGDLLRRIEQDGFPVTGIVAASEQEDAARSIAAVGESSPDWLVVDNYRLGKAWETALRPLGGRILAIDDIARAHDCDALLDQNWCGDRPGARYEGLVPAACRQLLGPDYALIGAEYAVLRGLLPAREAPPRRVLVSFGGGDPTNESAKALSALSRPAFSHMAVDLVLGPAHSAPAEMAAAAALRPGTTVHRGLRSLAGLMARADYALGAAGVTTWERLCLGLPSAVAVLAENQAAAARALAEAGYVRWIGRASDTTVDDYVAALSQPAMALAALPTLVDGLGTRRCAEYMLG